MTDQQTPGYRGALPPRDDSLARPWIAVVLLIFILMFVLAAADVPSRLFPGASPSASLAPSASASVAPSASVAASASVAPSASPAASQ